jgi:ribosomal protein S18 acetylase RimI-like enzyme
MPEIRFAVLGDAAQLAELAERTFRGTFTAQNTAEDMELHCRESYGTAIQAGELAAADRACFVASEGAGLIGFAQLRWGHAPECVAAKFPGEIQRLYVAREWHGLGVAQQLMQACLEELARRGSEVAWLGVWERNPRAISFYRKFGFNEVGAHVFPLGRDPQRDIVMMRAVGLAGCGDL